MIASRFDIVDAHVHLFRGVDGLARYVELMDRVGLSAVNIASLPTGLGEEHSPPETNCAALLGKIRHPGRFYSFAALHYRRDTQGAWVADFEEQARAAMRAGADGIKMVEGKPNVRRRLGMSLDSPVFDPFYSYLETHQVPLLLHVADPEDFWDRSRTPGWAMERGWFWGDGSHLTREALYRETEGILARHPQLNMILAHLFFLFDPEAAAGFLARHPNVSFDICGNLQMWLGKQPGWHGFFTEHADRLLYGTDSSDEPGSFAWDVEIASITRGFLETGNEYDWGRGIRLEHDVLEQIYAANFSSKVGVTPRPVDPVALRELCSRTAEWIGDRSEGGEAAVKALGRIADQVMGRSASRRHHDEEHTGRRNT